jgi:hypothetical protein
MKFTIDTENPEIRAIFSLMIFETGPMGRLLRAGGHDIPRKIEAEQVAVFFWLLEIFEKHGRKWRVRADEQIRLIQNDVAPAEHPQKITAKDGLLWREGKIIPLPEADDIARRFGFQHAEEFVRHLVK